MASKFIPADQALKNAYEAIRAGDKRAARAWAQKAASLEPDWEDPWLILAAVARPRASVAYLNRAIEINPKSARAREGLDWVADRLLDEQSQPSGSKAQTFHVQVEKQAELKPVIRADTSSSHSKSKLAPAVQAFFASLVVVLLLCLVAVWAAWPQEGASVLAAIQSNPTASQSFQDLPGQPLGSAKPTYIILPTVTFSPTATPFPTSVPTETASPTPNPTETPSPTPFLPDTPTSTAMPLPTITSQPTVQQPVGGSGAVLLPPDGRKRIIVVIHEQHLYAYQGSSLVYSFVASTGANNSTSIGTFSILDKLPRAYGADWNFWMPDWMGIYYVGGLENGIHSLPLLPSGQYIWGDSIGTPITYGCVVLGLHDAQVLYNWADIGTVVQINR